MIEFKNVFIQYTPEFFSLYDFNCSIDRQTLFIGDFFNGTNSIMRILSKIDKNYSGDVIIDNINIKKIKDKNLAITYLPETPALFIQKSLLKNLYYPLKIRKISKNKAKNMVFDLFFELKNKNLNIFEKYISPDSNIPFEESIHKTLFLKAKKLTFSEKKIITLIRAILRNPRYLLLENFFENLDVQHVEIVEFLLNKLSKKTTIIACEKKTNNQDLFKDFKVLIL